MLVTVEQPGGQGRMAIVALCYGLMVTGGNFPFLDDWICDEVQCPAWNQERQWLRHC